MINKIKELSEQYASFTVHNRRYLHQHPELSFEEHQTAAYVENTLREMGLKPQRMSETGVVALIEGQAGMGKVVALRADMDALPIEEANNVPYRSTRNGVMHACGHDVHTASLLSTARILTELRPHFAGTVKLIFQPGEERIPGGASLMIRDGVLQNPAPASIIGQHVMPLLPAGKIGFREGMYMASTDELYITISGRGGHAAMPDQLNDTVLAAAQLIVALQQIVSRYAPPRIPCVLSIGKVQANGATNIIPNEVKMEGTFRTMDEKWRAEAHQRMQRLAQGMAEAMGVKCDFHIAKGYPFLVNEPELTRRMRSAAEAYVGADNIVDLDLWMAGEDFAFYTQQANGCFYRLGTRNESRGIVSGVHTPTFDIEENALQIAPGLMAWMALQELGN